MKAAANFLTRGGFQQSFDLQEMILPGIRPTPFVTSPLDYADVTLFS
jgi:hypothetical protein